MKKTTKTIFKYLIEFLIVAFGVFLGIYVSELQSEKNVNKEKEKSINYILLELENNKKSIEKSIKYHQFIKTKLDSIALTINEEDIYKKYWGNKKFVHNRIRGWNGILFASTENTAFEGAQITGVVKEFDIEFIQSISKIYKLQEDYSEFGISIRNKMLNINSSTKIIDVWSSIQLMTTDLLVYEKKLLGEIDKVQTEIKTSL